MEDPRIQALIQIATALSLLSGGGWLAWRAFFVNKKKTEAEVEEIQAKAENTLALTVANLGVEVARLTRDLDEERQKRRKLEDDFETMKNDHETLKGLNAMLRKGAKILSKQLKDADITPSWTAPD